MGFGKFLGVVGGVIGASSTAGLAVYTAQNPDLVKDYINGNPTYSNQQMVDVKKDYQNKIDTLEDENSKEVSRLNALIASNNTKIAELEADNTAKSNKITELNNSVTLKNSEIKSLQDSNALKDEEIIVKTAKIEENNSKIAELQQSNTEQSQTISELQSDNEAKIEQINLLQAEVDETNSRIAELEQSDEDKSAEIAELQADNTAKTQEIATLTTSVNENTAKISELEADIEAKDNKIAELQADNTAKADEITTLQTKISEDETEISNLQSQNTELQSQITTLNGTIESNNTTITELQTKVDTYEDVLSSYALVTYVYNSNEVVAIEEKGSLVNFHNEELPIGYITHWSFDSAGTEVVPEDYTFSEDVTLYGCHSQLGSINLHFDFDEDDIVKSDSSVGSYIRLVTTGSQSFGSTNLSYFDFCGEKYYKGWYMPSPDAYSVAVFKNIKLKTLAGEEIEFISTESNTYGEYKYNEKIGGYMIDFTGAIMYVSDDGLYTLCFSSNSDVGKGQFLFIREYGTGNVLEDIYVSSLDLELHTYSTYNALLK